MTTITDTWAALEQRMHDLAALGHVVSLLNWDQEVSMPLRGGESRARQLAIMRVLRHERLTDPALGDLIEAAGDGELDDAHAAMVRNLRRDRDRALRLPPDFVRRAALAGSRGVNAWRQARSESDFSIYRPALEEVIAVKREEAELVGYDGEPYDALLDVFEPGMRVAHLEPILTTLRDGLVQLLGEIVAGGPRPDPPYAGRTFPDQAQWDFTMRLLADLGFDLSAGRQDRSAHPFTSTIALHDVRLTTRIDERAPFEAIFATIHEAGHGLYEQGFDPRYEDTPVADAPSFGLHESQSRLWENLVGRSRPFWSHYASIMQGVFPEALAGVDGETLYREANRVEPSLIRVESDEVTYNLHILIRFELELALLRGALEAGDLPAAWNEAYERVLDVRPQNDVVGVMQDIHWSNGDFGYFPSYTLGNLYSAMLWDAYRRADPEGEARIGRGEFGPLLAWLREHIHRRGFLADAEQTVRDVTGSDLSSEPFMKYLRDKYGELYGLA